MNALAPRVGRRVVIDVLRLLLVLTVLVILVVQVWFLPWLSGELADRYPAEAYLRWPTLALAVTGLLCVQVVLVCTLLLLGATRREQVFVAGSLRPVDTIIGALLAGSVICLAALVHNHLTVMGPPLWALLLIAGAAGGVGAALLMLVMRDLLRRAITMRDDLDLVV